MKLEMLVSKRKKRKWAMPRKVTCKVTDAMVIEDYRVLIRFSDGMYGIVDCASYVGQGVFKAWDDYEFFKSVHVSDGTVAWGNYIDICPDVLYDECEKWRKGIG